MPNTTQKFTIEYEIYFTERHWNQNAACMIPDAWVASIYVNGQLEQCWPCGKTLAEAEECVRREFPGAVKLY